MTAPAWIFMLLSVGFVTGLVAWCFRRVLTLPPEERADEHVPPGLGP